MVCDYKLINFQVPTWMDAIKMLFLVGEVEFEEEAIPIENNMPILPPEVKARLPWGQVPVLEYKGQQLPQLKSICRFLARKFSLTGKDEWECAKCDEIVDALYDLEEGLKPLFMAPKEDQPQMLVAAKRDVFSKFLGRFDTMTSDNGGQYLVGQSLTWADLFFVSEINFLESYLKITGTLEDYPHLQNVMRNVKAVPQLGNVSWSWD